MFVLAGLIRVCAGRGVIRVCAGRVNTCLCWGGGGG